MNIFDRLTYDTDENGCWNITSHKKQANRDYVEVGFNGRNVSAHRVVYMRMNNINSLDSNIIIRHSCDNPLCINPKHLLAGTKKDNTQDMMKRNRFSKWKGGRNNINGLNKRRKLTDEQIKEIKISQLSSYKLAEIYPVSAVQIRRIRNGTRCADV